MNESIIIKCFQNGSSVDKNSQIEFHFLYFYKSFLSQFIVVTNTIQISRYKIGKNHLSNSANMGIRMVFWKISFPQSQVSLSIILMNYSCNIRNNQQLRSLSSQAVQYHQIRGCHFGAAWCLFLQEIDTNSESRSKTDFLGV